MQFAIFPLWGKESSLPKAAAYVSPASPANDPDSSFICISGVIRLCNMADNTPVFPTANHVTLVSLAIDLRDSIV